MSEVVVAMPSWPVVVLTLTAAVPAPVTFCPLTPAKNALFCWPASTPSVPMWIVLLSAAVPLLLMSMLLLSPAL